jgi:hypothetical protein
MTPAPNLNPCSSRCLQPLSRNRRFIGHKVFENDQAQTTKDASLASLNQSVESAKSPKTLEKSRLSPFKAFLKTLKIAKAHSTPCFQRLSNPPNFSGVKQPCNRGSPSKSYSSTSPASTSPQRESTLSAENASKF